MQSRTGVLGLTLIEILVVLAVVGVLLSIAISGGYREYQKRNFQNDLASMGYFFEQARSVSVKTSTDQIVKLTASGSNVTLTITAVNGSVTAGTASTVVTSTTTFKNLAMCTSASSGCVTSVEARYKSPHGEMCWGTACSYEDASIPFVRNNNTAKIVLQGVFGYASIRDLQ